VEAEALAQISLLARISQLVPVADKASANNLLSTRPFSEMLTDKYLYCTLKQNFRH
jgi:hypothetical protein